MERQEGRKARTESRRPGRGNMEGAREGLTGRQRFADFMDPPALKRMEDFCRNENMRGLWFLFHSSLVLFGTSIFLQWALRQADDFEAAILLFVVIALMYLIFVLRHADPTYNTYIAIYAFSLVLGGSAVMGDTLFNPHGYSFLTLFFLFLIPQIIMDAPWRVMALDSGLCVFFIVLAVGWETGTVRQMDILRALLTAGTAQILGFRRVHRILKLLNVNTDMQAVAEHDPLTGAYNRAGGEMLIGGHVTTGHSGTFIILDIDNFKRVNDLYGHQAGDSALKHVAETLLASFRGSDIVMRIGGDEFVVYAVGMVDERSARTKVDEVCRSMHRIILDPDSGDYVTISMGCVINNGSYPNYDTLYHTGDRMLYEAKKDGKDRFRMLNVAYRSEEEKAGKQESADESGISRSEADQPLERGNKDDV